MHLPILFALILASPASSTFPFELAHHVIIVKASLGDSKPLEMALDSGTVRTTIDEAIATEAGLDLSLKAQSSGVNGRQEISVVRDQTLRFAGGEVAEPMVLAYPLDFLAKRLGHRVDGIIGVEVFRKYVVEINYPKQTVRVIEPGAFAYSGAGKSIAVTYYGRLPVVAGSVTPYGRDAIPTAFQLDTGAAGTAVAFWKTFVQKNDLVSGTRELAEASATGFGGSHGAKTGRVRALQIGGITFDHPFVRLNEVDYGNPEAFGGNLGSGFFEQFRVFFDLPHDRLILEHAEE